MYFVYVNQIVAHYYTYLSRQALNIIQVLYFIECGIIEELNCFLNKGAKKKKNTSNQSDMGPNDLLKDEYDLK